MHSIVSIIKTKPETIIKDIERLCELAGLERALSPSETTILKDNISWHMPFLSANTTPWQLEGAIISLRKAGYTRLVAVHNNTVVTDPYKGSRLNKLDLVYKRYNIPEKYNFIPEQVQWITYKPKAKMRVLHEIFREGIKIPEFFIGKNILHLPTLKCHIYTQTTGAMKNAFGGLLTTKRHYTHSVIHKTLVDLLSIQKEIHSGIFTIMDGTLCGCGPGPRTMIPVEKDYILASSDSVAIDAVAAKLMGFNPMDIGYIRIAHDAGLGTGDPRQITIKGEDIEGINFHFWVGDNFASRFGNLFWFSPLRRVQKILFRTPIVYLFVFGSYIYHDKIWWPFVGKKVQKTIEFNTKWGNFFRDYEKN